MGLYFFRWDFVPLCELLIKKLKNTKAFIDYSETIDDVYENLEDHDPTKKTKVLIVFDIRIADM